MNNKIKVFISQKMHGLSEEDVMKTRKEITSYLKSKYIDNDIEIVDNYHHNDAPIEAGRLWHLGRSIQQLGECDAIYFAKDAIDSNGGMVELLIAKLYGIKIIK